ncbi:hypothetical protein D9M71_783310 [compost metagenome]
MPGTESGRITCVKVCHGLAPRSAEACSNDGGRRSSEAWIGRIMNGSQMYTNTRKRPRCEVDSVLPPTPGTASRVCSRASRCSCWTNHWATPPLASSRVQA